MIKTTIIALSAILIGSTQAEEWTKGMGKKPGNGPANAASLGKISEKLDFAPYNFKLNGKPHLGVRVRNGKHKMGGSSISIKLADTPASIRFGRIDIFKPLSEIKEQEDGEHLLDSFISGGKTYEIYYTVKGGVLNKNITVRSKEG